MGQVDLQKLMMSKAQASAMLEGEVRGVAKEIYIGLLVPFIRDNFHDRDHIRWPDTLKAFAELATKSAPYLHQAAGMVTVDDEQLWGTK